MVIVALSVETEAGAPKTVRRGPSITVIVPWMRRRRRARTMRLAILTSKPEEGSDHTAFDGRWATVGSSNLDPLSLLLAREANVVVDDPAFAQDLRARLVQAMEHDGARVDPAKYANRPWRQRLLDRLAYALMRALLFLYGKRY